MVLSLVQKSNQDEISKSNTAPLLAETIVSVWNSEDLLKNKVNQTELPQLNEDISVPSLKCEQNYGQKVSENKKTKSVKAEII